MFHLSNPITFKYYPHFIAIYGVILVLAVALSIYKSKSNKKDKIKKRILQGLTSAYWQAGIYGFIFLGARYIRIALISMEFLHILNLLILTSITGYYAYRIKYGYKHKK